MLMDSAKNFKDAGIVALLKACANQGDLNRATRLHADVLRTGLLDKDCYVASHLIDMYAKCGDFVKAADVLDALAVRDVVSWSALITGYAHHGAGREALRCFECMENEGLSPDGITFISLLKACGSIGAVDKGKEIHDEIVRQDVLVKKRVLGISLVDMYAKCGALPQAAQVLDDLPSRDVVAWSALISGYAQQGQGMEALTCFERMRQEGLSPNSVTFVCLLKACSSIRSAAKGEQIHWEIAKQGLIDKDIFIGTALVDMYFKCNALVQARELFDALPVRSSVSWNALIMGYAQEGRGLEALNYFDQMECEGLSLNAVTFTCALKACCNIGAVGKGEEIHLKILRQGLLGKDIMLGNALVDMYAKCGALAKAVRVFLDLPFRNVVSWNALISGYVHEGQDEGALQCFERMQCEGVSPSAITFTSVLKASGGIGAPDFGEEIYDEIMRRGFLTKNIALGNVLVDMYSKCGALAKAECMLDLLPVRNVVSWSTLIAGYAQQAEGEKALKCLEQMQCEGISPTTTTFASVLHACSRSSLMDDGQMYFEIMNMKYGLSPELEHCTCMIELFGHAGDFDKALAVINKRPSCDHFTIWLALLGICQEYGNVELGKLAFSNAIQVDKNDGAPYALMEKIYAAAGMQNDADNISAMRQNEYRDKHIWAYQGF